jgi:hypothetical protein
MEIKKITKEDQEKKLNSLPLTNAKKKPPFSQWLLHDKSAFKITYIIGSFGGLLVTLALLVVSFIFDYYAFFKALFAILFVWQTWSTYKMIKSHKDIDMSINELAYRGKYDDKQYKVKKEQYDASKSGVPV